MDWLDKMAEYISDSFEYDSCTQMYIIVYIDHILFHGEEGVKIFGLEPYKRMFKNLETVFDQEPDSFQNYEMFYECCLKGEKW